MSPKVFKLSTKLRLRSSPVDKGTDINHIYIPSKLQVRSSNTSTIKLISKNIGDWNPFELVKCMICWKPIDIYSKKAGSYMECPHCHQKAHQDHMLRWLAKHHTCPYCRGKL
ncbi:MAG: RING finger protein [Candidatus Hodarchaeota archaeon]